LKQAIPGVGLGAAGEAASRPPASRCKAGDQAGAQDFRVGGEEREALVDDPSIIRPGRKLGQGLGRVFLPDGAVEKIWNVTGLVHGHRVIQPQLLPGLGQIAQGNELSASLRSVAWRRILSVGGFTAVDWG